MKKTLALVLALAMVFSTITVAFAEGTLSAEAQVCADLGMLKGSTGTVDAAYTATAPTRIQAAVMFLRLKGLEAEATAFTGEANFADADKAAWAKPIMAYLKANPQLGWQGDGTNFDPAGAVTAQQYYKVMLEALGYKQTTPEVVGDFAYADVFTFAASKGLTQVAAATNFTVNDLAVATVETLKANMKDGGKTLVATLVEAGKVDSAKAEAAGLIVVAPAAPAVAIDDVYATGNAVVVVEYEDDVDAAAAANVENYVVEGLEIKAATVASADTVVLDTAAMTAGKLYTMTVGEKSIKFTGISKVSGAPDIKDVVSEDIEEVVITFTKHIDLATGTNVANYSIAGVEIAKAEVDEDEVKLTTVGLKNKTKYTVKVSNVKSVDGYNKKTASDSFTSKFDTAAPKLSTADPETNQRIKVTFNEKVTEESAENLANYTVKVDEKDGASLEVISVEWDSDDENFVFVTTEAMEKNEDYEISVNGIVDQRKAANTMTRPSTKEFDGKAEDEKAPKFVDAVALSPTSVLVIFSDDSRIDEATVTDLNNYDMEDSNVEEIRVLEDDYQIFRAILTVEEMETNESYDLTVNNIADEFGNAIDESEDTVKATATALATPNVTDVVAAGENTILVAFSDEIDEDSAENIANYSIDEDLGAPTAAEYGSFDVNGDGDKLDPNEDYVVKLTVNDMDNGYRNIDGVSTNWAYDLTVDGVMDLAGNVLYYEMEVDTEVANFKWDTTGPDLEDADVVDESMVVLSFDEKVNFAPGSELILVRNDVDTVASQIRLDVVDRTDDFTVVEFVYDAVYGTLDPTVEFSVYKIVYNNAANDDGGIRDLMGNPILVGNITRTNFAFNGSDADHTNVEMDSYYQRDAISFEVTFDKNVSIIGGAGVKTINSVNWDVQLKGSDNSKVRLTLQGGAEITEDTEYTFDWDTLLTDKAGFPVDNDDLTADKTILTGEFTDEDGPYVDEVVAADRWWIKVTFDGRMNDSLAGGNFELRNYDLDEDMTIVDVADDGNNDGVVYLKTNKAMEARYEYELKLKDKNVTDLAGNLNTEETFYFDGSNLKEPVGGR